MSRNPIFMDPYDGVVLGGAFAEKFEPLRRNLGYTREYARRIDLARVTPRNALVSTKYCLADPGHAYLVYLSEGGKISVDLSGASPPVCATVASASSWKERSS